MTRPCKDCLSGRAAYVALCIWEEWVFQTDNPHADPDAFADIRQMRDDYGSPELREVALEVASIVAGALEIVEDSAPPGSLHALADDFRLIPLAVASIRWDTEAASGSPVWTMPDAVALSTQLIQALTLFEVRR